MDCTITVPNMPQGLTAEALSQIWTVSGCTQGPKPTSSFIECTIIDTLTGSLSVYSPLIAQKGQQTLPPVVPSLTPTSVIGCFFGTNGNSVTLKTNPGDTTSLSNANCVNGDPNTPGDIFGQFATCNGEAFFEAANNAIKAGKLTVPLPGVGTSGHVCYHTRSFEMVDADPNDNVITTYIGVNSGNGVMIAQATASNRKNLSEKGTVFDITNGSDERLKTGFYDPAFGCTSWKVQDLTDPNQVVGSLALNELQASAAVAASIAMGGQLSQFASIPVTDPMVVRPDPRNKDKTLPSLSKLNAYRVNVNQPKLTLADITADPGLSFCQGFVDITAPGLVMDVPFLEKFTSPDPKAGTTLLTFLAQRFESSYKTLNCDVILNKPSPIKTVKNSLEVAIGMTLVDTRLQRFVGTVIKPSSSLVPPVHTIRTTTDRNVVQTIPISATSGNSIGAIPTPTTAASSDIPVSRTSPSPTFASTTNLPSMMPMTTTFVIKPCMR